MNRMFTTLVSLRPCSWQRIHGMLLVWRWSRTAGTTQESIKSHHASCCYPRVALEWVQWPQCWNYSCSLGHSWQIYNNEHDFTASRRHSKKSSQGSVHQQKIVNSIGCCNGSRKGLCSCSQKQQETWAAAQTQLHQQCTSPPCIYNAMQRSWKRSDHWDTNLADLVANSQKMYSCWTLSILRNPTVCVGSSAALVASSWRTHSNTVCSFQPDPNKYVIDKTLNTTCLLPYSFPKTIAHGPS